MEVSLLDSKMYLHFIHYIEKQIAYFNDAGVSLQGYLGISNYYIEGNPEQYLMWWIQMFTIVDMGR